MKKIIVTICVLFFIVSSSSCENANKSINNDTVLENTTKTETEKIVIHGEGPSWSWDTSPIELDWYVSDSANKKVWDSENCWFDRWIREKTGITSINTISSSEYRSQDTLVTMMMTGQMPDAITIETKWHVAKYYDILQRDGYILPFDELASEYAPDSYKILPRSMIEWYRYEDGNFYGLINNFKSIERIDERNITGNTFKMAARKDIMDKLGISPEDFLEKESFIEALHKVKNANLKSENGDELKIFSGEKLHTYEAFARHFSGNFGLWFEDNEGGYIPVDKSPAFLESIKFINRIYREGLLTSDDFLFDNQGLKTRINAAGVFLFVGSYEVYENEFKSAMQKYGAYMVPVGPVHSDSGRIPSFGDAIVGGGTSMTMIPKGSDYPDRVIRLLGLLYSEQGQMAQAFGEEGLHYYIGEDEVGYKKAYWTKDFEKYLNTSSEQEIRKSIGLNSWPVAYDKQFCDAWTPVVLEDEGDIMNYNILSSYSEYVYDNTCAYWESINPPMNTEEYKISAKIDGPMYDASKKMILAKSEEEIDIIYSEAVEKCENLGWDELIKYQTSKLQELKKRMGIEFIPKPSADY